MRFGQRQRSRQRWDRRVGEKAKGPVRGGGQLGVIPIHGVPRRAVYQGSKYGRHLNRFFSESRGFGFFAVFKSERTDNSGALLQGAGENYANTVQNTALADSQRFCRYIIIRKAFDKFGHLRGDLTDLATHLQFLSGKFQDRGLPHLGACEGGACRSVA